MPTRYLRLGCRQRAVYRWIWLLVVVAATGCATRSASIGHRMLLPHTGARYATDATQFFVMPLTLAAPEPAFPELSAQPASGRHAALEVTVCTEIWLSADGDITKIAPFDGAPGCAGERDPAAQPYARSLAAALPRWEFTPAMICEFPPQLQHKRASGDCTGPGITVRRVPVRLNYAFTFSIRDGRRRVGFARNAAYGEGQKGYSPP